MKKYLWMSSAAVVIGTLRVKNCLNWTLDIEEKSSNREVNIFDESKRKKKK